MSRISDRAGTKSNWRAGRAKQYGVQAVKNHKECVKKGKK